jgi:hypothetical protein
LTWRDMLFSSLFDFGMGCIIAVMCPLDGIYPPSLSFPWLGWFWPCAAPLFACWFDEGVLFVLSLQPCLLASACLFPAASYSFRNVLQSFIACMDTLFPSTNAKCIWHGPFSISSGDGLYSLGPLDWNLLLLLESSLP